MSYKTDKSIKDMTTNKIFKNLIINGDFSVTQRRTAVIRSSQDFIFDRFQSQTDGSIIVGRDAIILPDSVPLVDNVDPFGDGSGVALWKLDGNANDAGGRYNGTWSGTEQYDTGIFGQAAKFDGNSYINLGNLDSIFTQRSYTVTGWIYFYELNGTFLNIRNLKADSSKDDCKGGLLSSYEGYPFVVKGTGDSKQAMYPNNPFKKNRWYFITIRHILARKTVQLFLNTKFVTELSYTGDLIFNDGITGHLGVHHYGTVYNTYLNGLIDQVRIFNRSLTDEEVQKLFYEESKVIRKPYTVTLKTTNKPSDYTNQTIKHLIYRFEGQHLYHLVAEGKKATLSFEMNTKKPGKYAVALINKTTSNYETLLKTFNYNGNQNEKISITFDLSQFQNEVRNDENLGFELVICGYTQKSNLVGTEGHNIGEKICSSDCVQIDSNDSISISKLQLEEGEIASEFEYIPYETQLMRCMRYYEKAERGSYSKSAITLVRHNSSGLYGGVQPVTYIFKVTKRSIPTINIYNITSHPSGYERVSGYFVTNEYARFHTNVFADNNLSVGSWINFAVSFDAEL